MNNLKPIALGAGLVGATALFFYLWHKLSPPGLGSGTTGSLITPGAGSFAPPPVPAVDPSQTFTPSNPTQCAIRLSGLGLFVNGIPMSAELATATCPNGAEAIVTGDARQGDWDTLQNAFATSSLPLTQRNS